MEETKRCIITGNLCGTDTRMVGSPCLCEECRKWLIENQKDIPDGLIELVSKHFWELI